MAEVRDPLREIERVVHTAQGSTGAASTVFVGIDPGAQGAIAVVCKGAYCVVDIPTMKVGVTRSRKLSDDDQFATGKKTKSVQGTTTLFNYRGIVEFFRLFKPIRERVMVALEKVPPTTGPGRGHADTLAYGAYMMWPLFLALKGYPVEEVRPVEWKSGMGLSGKRSTGDKNGRLAKEAARHKALALFPKADILRVMDHNRAEALLIAAYAVRKHGGK